jgi:phosphinothricin acetyltransferase
MARVRLATVDDAPEILALYSWYCDNDIATSEIKPPTLDEFTARLRKTLEFFPYFVAEHPETHRILGYAYGSFFHPRTAWRFICCTSIYVEKDSRMKHVGTLLYQRLLAALRDQHFVEVYAQVSLPNPDSMAFHAKFEFVYHTEFPQLTYKLGFWQPLAFLSKKLNERRNPPEELVPFSKLDISKYIG